METKLWAMIDRTLSHFNLVHNERTFLRLQRKHYSRSLAETCFRMHQAHTASFMGDAPAASVLMQPLLSSGSGFLVVSASPGMEHGVD